MFDRLVTFQANLAPNAVAFSTPDGSVTYAGFDADIDRVAAGLAPHVPPGPDALVAVQVTNPYAHWLVLLALARLGVASMPAAPERTPGLLVTDQPEDGRPGPRLHLTYDWLATVLEGPHRRQAAVHPAPGALGRLMFSSGTTGQRKAIALSFGGIEARTKDYLMTLAAREMRLMTLVGTDTVFGLMSGLAIWSGGGTLVYGPPGLAALAQALPALRPATLILATGQLAMLLPMLPDGVVLPDTRAVVGGSPVSRALATRTLARMPAGLAIVYGSTEAGGVAIGREAILDADAAAVGYLFPGQQVEIVDDAGQAVPAGNQGVVRVRGADAASGYLDSPEASAAAFRDGWFYPGDLGRLLPDGLLCIDGRTDDVMNIGGAKLLPAVFEDAALACPGVTDAAALALAAPGGGQRVHVAIVRGEDFDQQVLAQRMVDVLPGIAAPMLVWVAAIPRNAMAKPDRARLAAAIAAQMDPQGA